MFNIEVTSTFDIGHSEFDIALLLNCSYLMSAKNYSHETRYVVFAVAVPVDPWSNNEQPAR